MNTIWQFPISPIRLSSYEFVEAAWQRAVEERDTLTLIHQSHPVHPSGLPRGTLNEEFDPLIQEDI